MLARGAFIATAVKRRMLCTTAGMGTADLSDAIGDEKLVYPVSSMFKGYGAKPRFEGEIVTVQLLEDNSFIRETLLEDGRGKVLVADCGGSLNRAVFGDVLAQRAIDSGWEGLVIYGCIRDVRAINTMPIGVRALGTSPRRTEKRQVGIRDIPITFAGATFTPGFYLVADEDGIILGPKQHFNIQLEKSN